jgi:hypothetical protein
VIIDHYDIAQEAEEQEGMSDVTETLPPSSVRNHWRCRRPGLKVTCLRAAGMGEDVIGGRASLVADDGDCECFHRSARALRATRRHAGHPTRCYDIAGQSLTSYLAVSLVLGPNGFTEPAPDRAKLLLSLTTWPTRLGIDPFASTADCASACHASRCQEELADNRRNATSATTTSDANGATAVRQERGDCRGTFVN